MDIFMILVGNWGTPSTLSARLFWPSPTGGGGAADVATRHRLQSRYPTIATAAVQGRVRGAFHRCILAALLALVTAAAAATDDYLRGYVQALLDSRFPGLGLSVRALGPEQVMLTARACLGPSQKRDIERLLAISGRKQTVVWDTSTDCEGSAPAADLTYDVLPERELFAPLIADPRQPRFSVSYQRYKTPSQSFNAASVALGEYFGIASGFLGESGASQIGIQAAVFALFNLDAPSSDLINADYWMGIPLSYRKGPWSYLLRVYHQSSHLGDEFILGNPGINRVNLSYEDIELLVSYEWERLRFYGGGGYLLHSEPDLAPKHLQAGVEYAHPRAVGTFDFVAAADVRASEELDWRRSSSFQAGFELRSASQRRVRLMLEHFRGHSPNGQFYRDPLRYTGLGLYFGF